jgi:hypothetical protein
VKVVTHLHIALSLHRKPRFTVGLQSQSFSFHDCGLPRYDTVPLGKQVLLIFLMNLLRHLQCPTGPDDEVRNIISTLKTEAVSFYETLVLYLSTRLHAVASKKATAFTFT